MRSRCALYVDAGYLLAASATRLTGTSLRSGVTVDYPTLITELIKQAEELSGLPLLRVNWYDSGRNGLPDPEQEQLALLGRVKLRLGRIGYAGEQKGVDLRLGIDLMTHARNGAVDVMVLLSGDDDLSEAVEEAQAHGVQVIILGVPDAHGRAHGVSRHLRRVADDLALLDAELIDRTISRSVTPSTPSAAAGHHQAAAPQHHQHNGDVPSPAVLAGRHRHEGGHTPTTPSTPSPASGHQDATLAYRSEPEHNHHGEQKDATTVIDAVARQVLQTWLASATAEQRTALTAGRPSIPREIDKALLIDLSGALGENDLNDSRRHAVRERFWQQVEKSEVLQQG